MPFIGQQPTSGLFVELDSLSASATANYTLQLNGANYYPETVNNLLVSINGVIQGSSTMSLNGAVLTVGATLSDSDVIDFVRVFGNVGTISTPTDGSVTANKIGTGAVTDAKISTMSSSKLTGALPSSVTSSGIYLGGTGSANYLDDYEEGTFSVSVSTSGYTLVDSAGFYTKIGRQVTVTGFVKFDPVGSQNSAVVLGGLPFTSAALDDGHSYAGVARESVVSGDIFVAQVSRGTSTFLINSMDGVGSGQNQIFVANRNVVFNITYFV